MKKNSPNYFGTVLYSCEKVPFREAVLRGNGGWLGILSIYLFSLPFLALMLSVIAFVVQGLEIKNIPSNIFLFYFCTITLALYVLSIFLWIRYLRFIRTFSIVLTDTGVDIRFSKKIVQKRYQEIVAVYFGTKDRVAKSSIKVGKLMKPEVITAAEKTLNDRLSFEYLDGPAFRVGGVRKYFTESSLSHFLKILEEKVPGIEVN